MKIQMFEEAEKCLQCKKPLCQTGCPVHTDIPHVIALFKDRKMEEAGSMLFENNPMSLVCSIVCNHENQCTGHCVLNKKGTPVRFGGLIEGYISDAWLDSGKIECAPRKGIMTAVIGSGPAWITAAVMLYRAGYDVTVFEARSEAGGVPRYAIPDFRLPRSIMDRYCRKLLEMGIRIRTSTTIGGALDIDDLFRDGYQAVFVGTGVWRPKTLGIRGESLADVYYSIDYLAHPDQHKLGDRVAIIGMGNAAMDVARTVIRRGSRHVSLYARRRSSRKATDQETALAQLEGAELVYGKEVVELTAKGPVFRNVILDENDQVVGYREGLELVEADATIISISNGPKNKLVTTTEGLIADEKGLLVVDENGMTSVPGIFAAGDVVTGSKTVVHAVEGAKKAAASMIRYLDTVSEAAD